MIRLRTQYPNVNFNLCDDGRVMLNEQQIGRLFPDEYTMIAEAIEHPEHEEE